MENFDLLFILLSCLCNSLVKAQWPKGKSTRFYDFKVQTMRITKLCYMKDIITVNGMLKALPGYGKVKGGFPLWISLDDQRIKFRASSWITFPSVKSSQRRKSSVSDTEIEGKNFDGTKVAAASYQEIKNDNREREVASPAVVLPPLPRSPPMGQEFFGEKKEVESKAGVS